MSAAPVIEVHDGSQPDSPRVGTAYLTTTRRTVTTTFRPGLARRGRPVDVTEAVPAMHGRRIVRLGKEWPRCAGDHRDIRSTCRVQHGEGVAHDVCQGSIAIDAGHPEQVHPRMPCGQCEGEGVVESGVDIEDHRLDGCLVV